MSQTSEQRDRIVSVVLPSDMVTQLDAVSTAQDRTRSASVRQAVAAFLQQHGASGRSKLDALNALADQSRKTAETPGTAAGKAHLAEHQRLACSLTEE